MKQPKIFADSGWGQSGIELLVLYALITVAAVVVMDMHTLVAMSTAPLVMIVMLLGVLAFVQLTWVVVTGLEKLGSAIGLRKSPLT